MVNVGIGSLMDGVGEVLKNMPDPIGNIEIKGMKVVDF